MRFKLKSKEKVSKEKTTAKTPATKLPPKARPSSSVGIQERSENLTKSPKNASKLPSRAPPITNLTTRENLSKSLKDNPKVLTKTTPTKSSTKPPESRKIPKIPEYVRILMDSKSIMGSYQGVRWENEVIGPKETMKNGDEIPRCYLVRKKFLLLQFSDYCIIRYKSAETTKRERIAMLRDGIIKDEEEAAILTEIPSIEDWEEEEIQKTSKPPEASKPSKISAEKPDKSKPSKEILKTKMTSGESNEAEKIQKTSKPSGAPEDVKKTSEILKVSEKLNHKVSDDVKAPEAQNPKTSKIPEDVKVLEDFQNKKNPEFVQSNYIARGLNEESGYCSQKDSEFSKDGNVQKTLKDSEGSKSQNPKENQETLKILEDVKNSHEDKMSEKVPEDVEAPGAPKPKTLKNPENVKIPEDLQNKKNPEFIQSNYIAKGLNEDSGYCSQKDTGFSKDGDIQKTLKDSEGSKS